MTLTTLIFDLDGTLIDSAPDLRTACNKLLQSKGRREITLEETKKFVGNGAAKLVERAFAATGEPAQASEIAPLTQDFLAFYDGHEADETGTYPSVMETLQQLKQQGYRMALCTNKPQKPTQNILEYLPIESFFDVIIGGDQVAKKKPDAEMLLTTLTKMGITADQAVMIGDSPNDIGAADNAEMASIAVSYGYRRVSVEELGADRIIDHMSQLPDALEAMKA
ncbi:phosphoglycolate phosphatase [Terasakiella pusilla]|uniref:phosphoglycolate phosphatase n=1 Tax=Terasakiella pusilla TaxID=64973 RepID=UPI003AA84FC7